MKSYFTALFHLLLLIGFPACNKINLKEKCCDDSKYEQVITDDNLFIFVPNIFTPNGDGVNDTFQYYASFKVNPDPVQVQNPAFTVKKLKVFKLNGVNPVYENNSFNNDFEGKNSKGKELDEGRYRYELTLDNHVIKGSLCLIRSKNICTEKCRAINPQDPTLSSMTCE